MRAATARTPHLLDIQVTGVTCRSPAHEPDRPARGSTGRRWRRWSPPRCLPTARLSRVRARHAHLPPASASLAAPRCMALQPAGRCLLRREDTRDAAGPRMRCLPSRPAASAWRGDPPMGGARSGRAGRNKSTGERCGLVATAVARRCPRGDFRWSQLGPTERIRQPRWCLPRLQARSPSLSCGD